jgi:hypothetical protein
LKAELILAYLISFHFGLQVWLALAFAVFPFSGQIVEQKRLARRADGCISIFRQALIAKPRWLPSAPSGATSL